MAQESVGKIPTRWIDIASERGEWRGRFKEGVSRIVRAQDEPADKPLTCPVCGRSFRRRQGNARHKCFGVRANPNLRPGWCNSVTQCPRCHRWYRSRAWQAWLLIAAPLPRHLCCSRHLPWSVLLVGKRFAPVVARVVTNANGAYLGVVCFLFLRTD